MKLAAICKNFHQGRNIVFDVDMKLFKDHFDHDLNDIFSLIFWISANIHYFSYVYFSSIVCFHFHQHNPSLYLTSFFIYYIFQCMMNQAFLHKMDKWSSAMTFVFCKKKPLLEHLYDFCYFLTILTFRYNVKYSKLGGFKIYMFIFIFSWKEEATSRQTSCRLTCSWLSSVYRHS